ncbi:proteasome subunit alpha type-7 [Physcia stellaris]|nr:proteasome subunit alpha type-7 [Physcia stellaris]
MCGFGDKDRRPITPPPCIKLIVRDAQTGKDIDISEIDTSFFVLTVDLWSPDASKEVNLVRHSATSPSISAATSASYPPRPPTPTYATTNSTPTSAHSNWPHQPQMLHQSTHPPHAHGQPYAYPQPPPLYPNYRTHQPLPPPPQSQYQQYPPQQYGQQQQYATQQQPQGYYAMTPANPVGCCPQPIVQGQGPLLTPDQAAPQSGSGQPSGMFTRNLIGSLCVSAFKLTDPNSELGIWFILQDLSVRTEGSFRYGPVKFLFNGYSIQLLDFQPIPFIQHIANQEIQFEDEFLLASIFSGVFQVFSAKKFPGVIESTQLSKCFATQGIKIPIRKDGPRGNVRDRDEYEEDNE